jgi:hypothetical protein
VKRYRDYSKSDNGLFVRSFGYALTVFVTPFVLNIVRNKLAEQKHLLCNKSHGKLQVMDSGKFISENVK